MAVLAWGYRDDDASLRDIDVARVDPDPLVRIAALGSLRRRSSLNGTTCIEALNDVDPGVRQRAAQLAPFAAGHGATDELAEALIRALRDPVPLCVVTALEAIGARGDVAAVDAIVELAVAHADPLVHEECVATLAALGDPRGRTTVLDATNGRPALRRRAVAALGAFEGDDIEAALDRLAEDRDWQVRQAVAMLRREELDAEPPS